ncbi:MAG: class I SAM-dependent methyltransferase, partial [Brevefilum sp.]
MTEEPHQTQEPIAQDAYNQLADAYAARIETKPHNAYYERPATLSLLPEVKGKRILDAGCGPGLYAEILVGMGADVVALDANPKMVALARARLGDQVQVIQASFDEPLDFLADESVDLVVAPLVMDYVRDWRQAFGEFWRVLRPGGVLVFSMEHPMLKYFDHQAETNYFNVERVSYTWRGFGAPVTVPSYWRPMG